MWLPKVIFVWLLVASLLQCAKAAPKKRKLPKEWQEQLDDHDGDITKIINYLTKGQGKHVSYDKLAQLTDIHGHRLSGSDSLESAIDYLIEEIKAEGLDVHTEAVEIPHWVRGKESAFLVEPRVKALDIMGLGQSVGTPEEGIEAEVIVVKSFDELEDRANEAEGKIVVFNQPWEGYFVSYVYRSEGATRAAQAGAVAALVRSLTQLSVYSPHTGVQRYGENVTEIPTASLTVEDAEWLQRIHDRGEKIVVNLTMTAENLERKQSRNIVAEIKGSTLPDEAVIFGGHVDSWDVGVGAMDDGGGVVISWQALTTIKALGLRPKRTMRAVLWNAEEVDTSGAKAYYNEHRNESVSAVMESDYGTFSPVGIGFKGSGLAKAILEELLIQLKPVNATAVSNNISGTLDVSQWTDDGFPTIALNTANEDYFYYHHTRADTMSIIDPDVLDRCATLWTVVAYVIADLDEMLPRDGDYPTSGATSQGLKRVHSVYSVLSLWMAILLVCSPSI